MDPNYVSEAEFQWSLGIFITAIVGALVVIFRRLMGVPSREEVQQNIANLGNVLKERIEALTVEKRIANDDLKAQMLIFHGENKEALRQIREDVRRLEQSYFSVPGQTRI
jgi:hypothetical protein